MHELNNRIILIAKHFGLEKYSDFAKKTGLSHQTVSNYMKGKQKPDAEKLGKIQQSFDSINALWLLTGKGEMLISEKKNNSGTEFKTNVNEPRPDYVKNVSGELKLKSIDDLGFDKDDPEFWKKLSIAQSETLDKYEKQIDTLMKSLNNSLDEIERLRGLISHKNA